MPCVGLLDGGFAELRLGRDGGFGLPQCRRGEHRTRGRRGPRRPPTPAYVQSYRSHSSPRVSRTSIVGAIIAQFGSPNIPLTLARDRENAQTVRSVTLGPSAAVCPCADPPTRLLFHTSFSSAHRRGVICAVRVLESRSPGWAEGGCVKTIVKLGALALGIALGAAACHVGGGYTVGGTVDGHARLGPRAAG